MSGEKKRLEQYLLQSRASNIVYESQVNRFQPKDIDRIRLLQAQQIAGQVPVSEKLKKEQKKKKKKGRKAKALRGDLSKNLTEQRRFTRGERREKDTEEPRIVGDPAPPPAGAAGFAYDPVIERRRLDIEEARDRQARLERIADRRQAAAAQDAELAVRRGELAAGRADRALIRAAGAPVAPAPIVIPPAAAPVINIAAPPPAQVRVGGPVINVPPPLPARADADPIPEIRRLGAEIRGDYNAFGQEQDERNRLLFRQARQESELENRQLRETIEAIEARQQAQDENRRSDLARQDATYQEFQERIGAGEASMAQSRDRVIQEIRDAEDRLRRADRDLDRPIGYDDVLITEFDRQLPRAAEAQTPAGGGSPSALRLSPEEGQTPSPASRVEEIVEPVEPAGIGAVIGGGGELNLPPVVVDDPGSIEAEPPTPQSELSELSGISTSRLARGGGRGTGQESSEEELSSSAGSTGSSEGEGLQFDLEGTDRLELDPVNPVNVTDVLRLSRLAIDQAEPVLQREEEEQEDQAAAQRLRLVDTQDFLAGFERPASPRASPLALEGGSPIVGGGTAASRLERLLAQPSPTSPLATPTPRAQAQEDPSTPEEEALLREAYDEEQEEEEPRPGQVAEGIAQFGGAAAPAPPRVIEDAGIVALPEAQRPLRDLDPDVLFEAVDEAEQVGQVQDQGAQRLRDSQTLYQQSASELASAVRPGPRGSRGGRGGLGYRVRNNTDRTLKKVKPGDVVNVIGVEQGADDQGVYRLDTETAAGTRVGLRQLDPLIDDGSLIFERGHRHELGGHFNEEPYGPPPEAPGLLQQGAEAAGGAVAGVVGGAARLAGGVAQGVGQGLYEQLPAAGDVGAALGRGAVAGVAGAARLAGGAVAGAIGGGEEEEEEEVDLDEP
tara:strand:- start:688 stop:3384 length:2697 start_codon:yes stop_codon:yes gene_type:complete